MLYIESVSNHKNNTKAKPHTQTHTNTHTHTHTHTPQALEAKAKKKGLELLRKLSRKLQDKRVRVGQVLLVYGALNC